MSSAKISRLNELREYAKRRINEDINKTLDEVFDVLVEDCLPNQLKTIWPSGGLGATLTSNSAISTSLITDNHHAVDDSTNQLKRTLVSKQSTLESFLADGDGSSSASSGTEFNLFNSASLKKIFDQAYNEYTPPTPDECSSEPASSSSLTNGGCSDCECDHSNANCANENEGEPPGFRCLDKDFSLNDLMAEINQKVFSNKEMPLKLSIKESSTSLSKEKESHFVVPPGFENFGPITPPSKPATWGSSVVSFAKVAALSAAKSPTKTSKSSSKSSRHVLTVIGNQNISKKGVQNGVQQPQQQYDYNHQFRTRQVNCFVDKCRATFSIVPMLNEHLKDAHGMQKHRCPLIASCGTSFADSCEIPPHLEDVHPNQLEWICEKCPDEKFPNYRALGQHHYFFHQDGIFECKEEGCFAQTSNRGGIIAHCKTKHGQGSTDPESYFHLLNFNNQNLNKTNNTTSSYQLNILAANLPTGTASSRFIRREHQFETVYVNCVIQHCALRMANMDELNEHLLKVHNKSAVFCPIYRCSETFDQMCQVDLHVLRSHTSASSLNCGLCNFIGREHRQLSGHIYWQHSEGLFKCTKCPKTGKYRNDITAHYSTTHLTNVSQ